MEEVIIRRAVQKDLNKIYPLFLELVKSEEKISIKTISFFKELKRRKNNFEANSKKELLKDIKGRKSIFLIAEKKGEILGYVSGKILDSKNPFYQSVKLGYFNHIVVSKKYMGKGIAKKLYFELEKNLKKNCDFIYLEVFSSNSARKKFEKFGYKTATHKMWKKLK